MTIRVHNVKESFYSSFYIELKIKTNNIEEFRF
jgi:hypothetical protein